MGTEIDRPFVFRYQICPAPLVVTSLEYDPVNGRGSVGDLPRCSFPPKPVVGILLGPKIYIVRMNKNERVLGLFQHDPPPRRFFHIITLLACLVLARVPSSFCPRALCRLARTRQPDFGVSSTCSALVPQIRPGGGTPHIVFGRSTPENNPVILRRHGKVLTQSGSP